MDYSDVMLLLSRNEDEHIEFKEARSSFDFDKLVDYSVALANERGGLIILGVSDKKPRRIVGTQAYADGISIIQEHLIAQIQLRIDVEEIICLEGRVLVFHVPSRPLGVPKKGHGRYLMRSGEALTTMSDDMVKRIFDEAEPDYSAEICHKAAWEDLDVDSMEEFRRRWAASSGNAAIAMDFPRFRRHI
jgi:Predicted transcriptional regulator containing an HTH domain and an uncharacterized domain shared with the mammalian protein Schlafen